MWPFAKKKAQQEEKVDLRYISTPDLLETLRKDNPPQHEGNRIVHELLYRLNESIQARIWFDTYKGEKK